ncbi:hypothetical protein GCM10009557_05950 [Virgisporangium ochraceum]|uniref:Uncharacterized protein n=1 Tax=Virgisporangium ochraceum TaxID=65505 RepID=A0A8J4EBW6_9ACTN|nr:hypothetical protein [Virgisporangium ochraceum]GIJ66252.1 hypothetical protein Voc01_011690 [Virgisporangium ochraceum]
MLKITAPKPVTAKVVGVAFVDGVATVDEVQHRAAVAYFRRHRGYIVQPVDDPQATEPAGADETGGGQPPAGPPTRSASKGDWVKHATAQGMTEADAEALTRDQLAERFLGPKGD